MTEPTRVMYEVVAAGTKGFSADVLKFTDDKALAIEIASLHNAELWQITYVGDTWKRWKEERLDYASPYKNQLTMF